MSFEIRQAQAEDLNGLLRLYTVLGDEPCANTKRATDVLARILKNESQHLLVAECDGTIAASVTLTVVDSLTHAQHPYGVVEHVVTLPEYRRRGLAAALLHRAQQIADEAQCYKLMLITKRTDPGVHALYRSCGYKSEGYTAYVLQLIDE